MTSRALLLTLFVSFAGCASPPPSAVSGSVDTLDALVVALADGGYGVTPLSPGLFPETPQPVAAYDVTQRDGTILRLLAYAPSDLEQIRADIRRERPRTGFTEGREHNVSYRPGRRAENQPRLFSRGDVLLLFPYGRQFDLYYDLTQLLGDPTY